MNTNPGYNITHNINTVLLFVVCLCFFIVCVCVCETYRVHTPCLAIPSPCRVCTGPPCRVCTFNPARAGYAQAHRAGYARLTQPVQGMHRPTVQGMHGRGDCRRPASLTVCTSDACTDIDGRRCLAQAGIKHVRFTLFFAVCVRDRNPQHTIACCMYSVASYMQ